MTISELTERELVARVQEHLGVSPSWLVVGIGDDAAVVEPERNRLEVLTVDAVIDGVHFDRRFTPPDAIGHRALAVNLSDLAAMGAQPRLALLSFALPADLPCDDFDAIVRGIMRLAKQHGVVVVGGNLTRTPGPLAIDITAVGVAKRRQVLTRSGALPGDHLYVTGTLGASAAGLQALRSGDATASAVCIERYLRPTPRVRAGLLLARNRAASSCIDLSDGLADGVARLSEASGVGIAVNREAVPLEGDAAQWFAAHDHDAVLSAAAQSDDYELLFTVRPRHHKRLKAMERHGGVALTRIGVCTDTPGVVLRSASSTIVQTLPAGFTHFR